MAENLDFRNNALPYPVSMAVGTPPYTVVFPILDADGDPVAGAADLDSEISINGDTFANCFNETAEIAASSGMYSLKLDASEMQNADIIAIVIKTSTPGAKTTPIVLYPRKLVLLTSGMDQSFGSSTIQLESSAGTLDDAWNGCLIVADTASERSARIITDYDGVTKIASVNSDWGVEKPDGDDYWIFLPEGMQIPTATTELSAAHAELTATPADNASLADKIEWLLMQFLNKETQTDSLSTVSNNAGTVISEAVVSEVAGTTTKEKFANP